MEPSTAPAAVAVTYEEGSAYTRFVKAAKALRAAQRELEAASTEYREALEKLSALVAP